MSLDLFGGIVSAPNAGVDYRVPLINLCQQAGVLIAFDSLDEEDVRVVANATRHLGNLVLTYAVGSEGEVADATSLWIEARDLAMQFLEKEGIEPVIVDPSALTKINLSPSYYDAIRNSRLGRFISGLQLISTDCVAAIAVVDGGVETVKSGVPEESIEQILRSFILPWDCLENALYVCNPYLLR